MTQQLKDFHPLSSLGGLAEDFKSLDGSETNP